MRTILLICIVCGLCKNAYSQSGRKKSNLELGYGASIIYNFHVTGYGADLRLKIPVTGKLFVVPEFSYFPGFNDYHEYYAGAALHYEIVSIRSYNFYLLGAAYYNNWINADDYAPGEKMKQNFAPEAGAGFVRNSGCIRPFVENRYDIKWKEDNLRIGIYFYPGSCGKGRTNRREKCPAVKT